jgi:hypothetical protein
MAWWIRTNDRMKTHAAANNGWWLVNSPVQLSGLNGPRLYLSQRPGIMDEMPTQESIVPYIELRFSAVAYLNPTYVHMMPIWSSSLPFAFFICMCSVSLK